MPFMSMPFMSMPFMSMPFMSMPLFGLSAFFGATILAAASFSEDSESIRNCAEVSTSSPALTPASTCTPLSLSTPSRTSRGSKRPLPVRTNTFGVLPVRITASEGMTTAFTLRLARMRTSANMSGFSSPSLLSNSSRTLLVRVFGSK